MDLDLNRYKNVLAIQGFEPASVVNSCVNLDYKKDPFINVEVEDHMRWPQFVRAFVAFVVSNNRIPSQSDFFYYYIGVSYRTFLPVKLDSATYNGLKARLTRMYPSLVRDMHFACSLKKERDDLCVFYHPDLDVENDIDVLVVENDLLKAFVLYVQTPRARQYRMRKFNRHKRFDNVQYYEVALSLRDVPRDKVGLYDISPFINRPLKDWLVREL